MSTSCQAFVSAGIADLRMATGCAELELRCKQRRKYEETQLYYRQMRIRRGAITAWIRVPPPHSHLLQRYSVASRSAASRAPTSHATARFSSCSARGRTLPCSQATLILGKKALLLMLMNLHARELQARMYVNSRNWRTEVPRSTVGTHQRVRHHS